MVELVSVSITAADTEWLARFATSLVDSGLAACGNIHPHVRSIYRWQGAIEDESEALLTLHTRAEHVPAIVARTDAEHPYETPQVVATPVVDAHPDYRDWVIASTGGL